MVLIPIGNQVTFIAAMADWNGGSANTYALTTDVTLSVTDLNAIVAPNQSFNVFTSTFDGAGNILTLDGTGTTDISKSLFMDLSGGTIRDFTFDIEGCTTTNVLHGFLVGKTVSTVIDYGIFLDINVNNLGSTIPTQGGHMVGGYFGNLTSESLTTTVTNCNFTGNVAAAQGGGLFGWQFFYDASGTLIIDDCDISGDVSSEKAGGIAGDRCCAECQPSATIDITNCTFTGTVSSNKGGGLFGFGLFYGGAAGTINITDCDISGNITGDCPGGLAGQLSFYTNTVDASINITNCNFTGVVSGPDAGGLFGGHCFQASAGDIIIQDCDISATVGISTAGGLGGDNNFYGAASTMSADILNCTFTGDITGANAGGLFGQTFFINGDGTLIIHDCDISANITGSDSGGLLGSEAFKGSISTSTIDICNNTISVNLQGRESGGLFGSQFLFDSEATLNIENNTITVTGIDVSNAGISVYELGSFDNADCSVNIINNTIRTTTAVPPSDFGGIFYVNSTTVPDTPVGLGTLTITGNDLSGITFTSNPPSSVNYLFNEDGISFFDGTGTEIFATLTLNPNTYGPITFDISNITTWQEACEYWTTNKHASSIFRLTDDTSLNVVALNALEDSSNNFNTFTATFDGCGNRLTLDGTLSTDISNSLFMDLSGGTIRSFTFDVSGCTTTDPSLGFLVGISGEGNYGNFLDINVNNLGSDISGTGGIMVGRSFGYKTANDINITNCNFYGDVSGNKGSSQDGRGGLFGISLFEEALGNIVIENCDISGHISAHSAGGIAGRYFGKLCTASASIDICNCTYRGNIGSATAEECGGLFGGGVFYQGAGDMVIENCDISGNIIGDECGGIGGKICCYQSTASANITISNCDFTGDVSGTDAGGLFGSYLFRESSGNLIIQNSEIVGNIIGVNAGGIAGSPVFPTCRQPAIITISNCNFTGDISNSYAGGLFGGGIGATNGLFNSGAGDITIQNCDISGIVSGESAGGIAGQYTFRSCTTDASINITNCNFTGDVSGQEAGGLFGGLLFDIGAGDITIQNCDISGNITGEAAGGIAGQYAFRECTTDASINITNCNFTGDISANYAGGLFGGWLNGGLCRSGAGDITIQNCDISGIVSGNFAGGICGERAFRECTTDASINITNCNFTGDVSGQEAGGLFGDNLFISGAGDITIQDCSITGNITGEDAGGIGGKSSFVSCTTDASINITNCNFIGDVEGIGAGGFFGDRLFDFGSGDITIRDCDIVGNITGMGAGGIGGKSSFVSCTTGTSINITNCNFTGDVTNTMAGGLFGERLFQLGFGDMTIQNCDVNGTISGTQSGGLGGYKAFIQAQATSTIDICNNTISVNLQGVESGGLFGSQLLVGTIGTTTLNIKNNTITITGIDVSNAGISVYESGSFDNNTCTLSITNNTIRTTTAVPASDFGGIFYVNSGILLDTIAGSGTLTITGNDLSGINFTTLISPQGYLFNESGISFFDGSAPEIFNTLTLNPNTYGPILFDISNITTWQEACEHWSTSQYSSSIFRLISDTSLNVLTLNALEDSSNNFNTFTATFDGCGNTLTLDGSGGTAPAKSLFMDLSGGTIHNFRFDISDCTQSSADLGYLVGRQLLYPYGNLRDIDVHTIGSVTCPTYGGYMVGQSFGRGTSNTIEIANCNFTGDINAVNAGGLFGTDLFRDGSGTIIIQDCSINGNLSVVGGSSGGIAGAPSFRECTADASITISNCNFTGDVVGAASGGLFGGEVPPKCLFYLGAGNITIQNCDISGNVSGLNAGGITGEYAFQSCTTDASINITNCNFTGDVSGHNAGGLFGQYAFEEGVGDITIQDCDIIGNITKSDAGGIAGQYAFKDCTTDASINITNCNFTGNVSGNNAGGLFGQYALEGGEGNITIQNCDISGNVSGSAGGAGGIAGPWFGAVSTGDLIIQNCNFTGDISGSGFGGGGLFGAFLFRDANGAFLSIQNCDISGNVSGQNAGGIAGRYPFANANSTSTIDICNNTISVNLQGAESGGLFGSELMQNSEATLNIENNTITITGIDVSNAGISVYESGGFTNIDCSVNITNNTIQTTTAVGSADFGGIFYVNSGTIPSATDGSGNLTITGNDLSGITFTTLISPQGYLFNEAGISFFDGSAPEIFNTLTLNPNTYGPILFDISNITTWQEACEHWSTSQYSSSIFRLISDTSLNVVALNLLADGSNNFNTFTATFDGCGNTLTLDGTPGTAPTKSLFMDLSGGIIQNFTFDISDCTQGSANRGYLVGESVFLSTVAYGNFYDININNLGSTSVTSGGFMGGRDFGRSLLSSRTIDISNCNFIGDVNTSSAAGLFGTSFGFGAEGNINITNCDFTGDVTNTNAGGLFGVGFGQSIDGNITIQNCDVSGNITGQQAGGIAGRSAVKDCTAAASITITNCNFTGDVTRTEAGGLFGNDFFETGAGDITIQNCDFSGNITNTRAGGITGSESFKSCTIDASINITNCNFTGNVTNTFSGGLFGFDFFNSGAGDITIQDCSINGTISGSDAGGIAGGGAGTGPFIHATSSATININNNTIDVDLQGTDSGGLFGSQLMENSDASLNIQNNTITITPTATRIAGISTYETGAFDNSNCTVKILNNVIKTTGAVASADFGGVFYVHSGTAPANTDGCGNLTITGNDLSGIDLTSTDPGPFPDNSNNYLFNDDGMVFFDGSGTEIFLNLTINNNTLGPFTTVFDISNITTWQAACEKWNLKGIPSTTITTYRLSDDTSLNVVALNLLGDGSNNFDTFTATFDGCGNTLMLDGTGSTDISNSLFMDLSGGTIQDFRFDISGCTTAEKEKGFLIGDSATNYPYGNLRDIDVYNLDSSLNETSGGYMAGAGFGQETNNTIEISNCNFTGDVNEDSAGGLFGGLAFRSVLAAANITITNCDVTGDVSGDNAGGLFGAYFFKDGSGTLLIQNCDICGNITGVRSGGIAGFEAVRQCTSDASINITNCNFTGDVSGDNAGGLFGYYLLYQSQGDATIQNCDVSGNITGGQAGGIAGQHAFKGSWNNSNTNITNCNFTGDVSNNSGGLFGGALFSDGAADITIQDCDIIGNITGNSAGGIGGQFAFITTTVSSNINITNCSFTGDVNGDNAGGLFGDYLLLAGGGNLTIQNCDISGTISGQESGGLVGGGNISGPFYQSTSDADININSNTIDVDLQGTNSGGLFGSQLMETSQATLNIDANVITITSAVAQTAGISVYESVAFDNLDCSVNIRTNTIQTLLAVSPTEFGGIFYVNSGIGPLTNLAGSGTLLIENNNFSGISFATEPSSTDFYLFNDDGVPFFDDSINDKIFSSRTIINNTFPGTSSLPTPIDFSTYDFMLQWIYKNSLTALEEQTWFESYALYLRREQVIR